MPRYKVLRSAAHNLGHSFISVLNFASDDYVMCHLLRAAAQVEATELRIDLLGDGADPPELVPPPVADAIARYRTSFPGHLERSGASIHRVRAAEMRITIQRGRLQGRSASEPLHPARLVCDVTITDDRGKVHRGSTEEIWVCHRTRYLY